MRIFIIVYLLFQKTINRTIKEWEIKVDNFYQKAVNVNLPPADPKDFFWLNIWNFTIVYFMILYHRLLSIPKDEIRDFCSNLTRRRIGWRTISQLWKTQEKVQVLNIFHNKDIASLGILYVDRVKAFNPKAYIMGKRPFSTHFFSEEVDWHNYNRSCYQEILKRKNNFSAFFAVKSLFLRSRKNRKRIFLWPRSMILLDRLLCTFQSF